MMVRKKRLKDWKKIEDDDKKIKSQNNEHDDDIDDA